MSDEDKKTPEGPKLPDKNQGKEIAKAVLQVGGGIPGIGGFLSAAASAWSEQEQENVNKIFQQWIHMLQEELQEKGQTILEIMARIDMQEEKTKERVESDEYQSLMKKSFRNWPNINSESKRKKIRNLLTNAAVSDLTSDDVVSLFIDWLNMYSDFHFEVIGEIYRKAPISRGEIWDNLGRKKAAENSAEADLYKMLIRDLSVGSVIRQQREVDAYGNFIQKRRPPSRKSSGPKPMKSAFDYEEKYELTGLGQQFVHYAMTEITPRIEFQNNKAA